MQIDEEAFKQRFARWDLMTGLGEVHFIVGDEFDAMDEKVGNFWTSVSWARDKLRTHFAGRITFINGSIVFDAPGQQCVRAADPQFRHPFE